MLWLIRRRARFTVGFNVYFRCGDKLKDVNGTGIKRGIYSKNVLATQRIQHNSVIDLIVTVTGTGLGIKKLLARFEIHCSFSLN